MPGLEDLPHASLAQPIKQDIRPQAKLGSAVGKDKLDLKAS